MNLEEDIFNPQLLGTEREYTRELSKNKKRRNARQIVTQALYQKLIADHALDKIEEQFSIGVNLKIIDFPYFRKVLYGVYEKKSSIDQILKPFLNISVNKLDPIELSILRISTWEMTEQVEIPYKVIINEAIELTKMYGSVDGYKFVNGVMNKVFLQTRSNKLLTTKN